MKKETTRLLLPIFLVFVAFNSFFLSGKVILDKWNVDWRVLIAGNLLIFFVTLLSFFISNRGLRSSNTQAFIRSIYASFILKFFVIAAFAFIYIIIAKKNVNKAALIACMFLYLLYTFFEVSILMKVLKKKKNE